MAVDLNQCEHELARFLCALGCKDPTARPDAIAASGSEDKNTTFTTIQLRNNHSEFQNLGDVGSPR